MNAQLPADSTAPPLSAGIDVTTGYGILHSPEAPRVSASTIEGLSASLSFSYGFISFGMTIFIAEIGFIHRGIQLDVGVSIGSIGFLPINIPVSITVANGQITTRTTNEAGEDVGGFAFVTGPTAALDGAPELHDAADFAAFARALLHGA